MARADVLGLNERTLEKLEYGRAPVSALWEPIARVVELLDRIDVMQEDARDNAYERDLVE